MTGRDSQLEQARLLIEEARRALETVGGRGHGPSHDRNALPLLVHHLHQVIHVADGLLAQREQYESRLHRTPPASAPVESSLRAQ